MPLLRGLVVKCGLTALPLALVILLCCLMSWAVGLLRPGKGILAHSPELTAQAADVASMRLEKPETELEAERLGKAAQAGFERLRIVHARINVPR